MRLAEITFMILPSSVSLCINELHCCCACSMEFATECEEDALMTTNYEQSSQLIKSKWMRKIEKEKKWFMNYMNSHFVEDTNARSSSRTSNPMLFVSCISLTLIYSPHRYQNIQSMNAFWKYVKTIHYKRNKTPIFLPFVGLYSLSSLIDMAEGRSIDFPWVGRSEVINLFWP